jgi:hypothetical protein
MIVSLLGTGLVATTPKDAPAYVSVSVSYFYGQLAPYGQWVDDPAYGQCWVPAHVASGWRPYSDGYWAYTDYGWTWVDYAPYGWAVYHYGRWVLDPYYGWLWVPGTVWAPAWVAWRASDDWIGWAPLPPGGSTFAVSFTTGSIPADRWCFVPTRDVFDRDLRGRIRPAYDNVAFVRSTSIATRFSTRGGRTMNLGVSPDVIQRRTGRPVSRFDVVDASSPAGGHGQRLDRNRLAFYRPSVRSTRGAAARPEDLVTRQGRTARPQASRSWNENRSAQRPRTGRDVFTQVQRQSEERGWRRSPNGNGAQQWYEGPRGSREFRTPSRDAGAYERAHGGGGGNRIESAPAPRPEWRGQGQGRPDRGPGDGAQARGNGGGGHGRGGQDRSNGGGGAPDRSDRQANGNSGHGSQDRAHRGHGQGHGHDG